jgi:small subunit ribosomal protein S18e
MSLQMTSEFQHILRVLNTNIDGKRKSMFAMTKITGIGKRFSNIICKKAEVEVDRRAGTMSNEEIEKLVAIINNPKQFKVPDWFVNRQKDFNTGKTSHAVMNVLIGQFRADIERMKKAKIHRGIRWYWGHRVRGQHTKTTGRKGKLLGQPGGAGSAK